VLDLVNPVRGGRRSFRRRWQKHGSMKLAARPLRCNMVLS
jgi:hypothetical protein